jgi:hypothetical protein
MSRRLLEVLLFVAATAALGGVARADEPLPPANPLPGPPPDVAMDMFAPLPGGMVPPSSGYFVPRHEPKMVPDPDRPAPPPRTRRPVRDFADKTRVNCWATHNALGCGSLQATCVFMFGSCRQFFDEECVKAPPHSVPAADDRRGCGCPLSGE